VKADSLDPEEGKAAGLAQREIRSCLACGTKFSATSEVALCPVCVLLGAAGDAAGLADSLSPVAGAESSSAETDAGSIVRPFENYEVMLDQDGKPIELGRGAMGITYKAFDIDLRFPVTLKVISEKYIGDQSARVRFLREARAAAKVRHPNVASVFHLGRSSGEYFYAMEFVEGETLESLIKRSGRVEVKLALEISAQAAAGLAAVHKQNLVHRDIKPSNIMVSLEEGGGVTAKLIDLGLAKTVSETAPESAISAPGGFAGTPEFASPEQFAGIGVDIRSDLYSLGVVLWEMLTGRLPFRGTPAELIYQHQHGVLPLEQLKAAPEPIMLLVEKLLDKDPARRFQTPNELLKTILKVSRAVKRGRTIRSEKLWPTSVSGRGVLQKQPGLTRAPERSVAVLPFESLSASKRDIYFADGVQDEILSNLAKISQLKVISRTSVMTYRSASNRDLRSIGAALGVARIVEGTVRRSGNRVRISTRLVDARTDDTLWSETYDREITDIFAIQNDIAQTVATKLRARLSPEERTDIEKKPTEDLEAYDLYLQAKELFANPPALRVVDEHASLLRATELLAEATGKDSNFALAHCLLTRAYDELYRLDHDKGWRALGDAAVNEALRLRPDLPAVHLQMAFHLFVCHRDYERARVHIAIAERALPNSPTALACTAYVDRRRARWKESTKCLEKAVVLDPRNPELIKQLAVNYLCLRRDQDFERTYDQVFMLRPEEKPLLLLERAFLRLQGKADLASCRDSLGGLPASMKDKRTVSRCFAYAVFARDWAMAKQAVDDKSNEELYFSEAAALVPRGCLQIWLARVQGDFPGMQADFSAARDQLYRKVEANPADSALLSALGLIDACLDRTQEAVEEAKRAAGMLPTSEDALEGQTRVYNLAAVYALTNEPRLAYEQLANLVKTLGGLFYGQLKLDPAWDSIRKDPRFEKLLAQSAPRQSRHKPSSSVSHVRTHKPSVGQGPKNISVARIARYRK
jgi:serine/threonine protein kinase/tetratricopeptide (TPR) repeat protein